MIKLEIFTIIAAVAASVGGYYLGVFSGRLRHAADAAFVAASALALAYTLGVAYFPIGYIALAFAGATAIGTASTYRIRPTDQIERIMPMACGAAVIADIIAITLLCSRHFAS